MINFNTVNKANTAQSLLPTFSETADISDKSFQSIFDSVKDNSFSPYSRKENSYSSYKENNSYSSYSDTKKYSDRASENKYSKDDNDYNRDDKRYSNDKENYEAVERKVYRDDSHASRNMKNSNTIKEQNVFEKKDVKAMQNNQAGTGSNKDVISNQKTQSNQTTQLESSQAKTISIKDMLALLQTASKNNTTIEVANDEEAALENINAAVSELNISDDLKIQLQNIISSLENMNQSDLGQLVEYIGALSEDINIADINAENISLEEISEKILGTEMDSSLLEKAYTALQEKISEFTNQSKDNAEVNTENTEKLASLISDKSNNTEIINNLSALIDEAVQESGLSSNNDKLELAKDIISTIKAAAENILYQSNISSNQISENTVTAEEMVLMNSEVSDEAAQLLDTDTESKQSLLNAETLAESSSEDMAESNNMQKLAEAADMAVEENINDKLSKDTVKESIKDTAKQSDMAVEENINNKQSNEKLSQETAKETLKDTVKESAKDIVKDTIKQTDTVSVKDVQKEFKTANVEVTESLRGESNAKAEIKANTVNFSETGKNLQNNLNQKEMVMTQNNAGENFSASQNDKGNNFNYFLKSSAEAQAKYDTAQSKEAQAPYNMKEPRDIERLVRTMQSSVSKGQSKLTVVLTPENLGRMQIQLSESGGKITAKFLSDNENSHKLIMAQSDLLKNQLSEKGIVVDNMEFAYNDAMSKQQNNDEQGRRTSKQAQKGKSFGNREEDLEVGTEVANKKATGIYA